MKNILNRTVGWLKAERIFTAVLCGLLLILLYSGAGISPRPTSMPPGEQSVIPDNDLLKTIRSGHAPAVALHIYGLLLIAGLTMLISGIGLNIRGWMRGDWRFFPAGRTVGVPWTLVTVFKAVVYFLFSFLLILNLEAVWRDLTAGELSSSSTSLLVGNAFIQYALIVIFVLGLASRSGVKKIASGRYRSEDEFSRRGSGDLFGFPGLTVRYWRGDLRRAFKGYIQFFPILIGLLFISLQVMEIFNIPYRPNPLVGPLLGKDQIGFTIILYLIGVIAAPLAEELFFRGFFFPALMKKIPVNPSILISAVFFSSLHLNWHDWLPIMGLGVLLARSYQKTGSLLVSIFIHAIHNAFFLTYTVVLIELTRG